MKNIIVWRIVASSIVLATFFATLLFSHDTTLSAQACLIMACSASVLVSEILGVRIIAAVGVLAGLSSAPVGAMVIATIFALGLPVLVVPNGEDQSKKTKLIASYAVQFCVTLFPMTYFIGK